MSIYCLVAGLVLCSFVGCDSGDEKAGSSQSQQMMTLRRGNGGDPGTLDPSLAEDVHAFNVLRDLYEGLVTEAQNGSISPGVASDWNISGDGLRYTFSLRRDALWSNGDPVTAEDFVTAISRVLSPETLSSYAFLLYPILNSQEVINGRFAVDRLGVRAIDNQTLEIELSEPASHFLSVLAMPVAFPVHRLVESDERSFANPADFVGNGAYILDKWQPGAVIRLIKNPRYWRAASVAIPAVEYFAISDPMTELNMYRAGELDITATIPPSMIASVREEYPSEVRIAPTLALYYVAFDLNEPPMSDPMLRQALSLAVDREKLVEIIGRGEEAAYGIVPGGVAGYESARFEWQDSSLEKREARARATYLAAGYNDDNPLQFKLIYDTGDIHETVALALASMWQTVLGAQVALEKREWQYFLASRSERDEWDAMRFAWFGDYNDASTFLDIFESESVQNLPGYSSDKYDGLLRAAGKARDPAERADLMRRAESVLLADSPVIPLYFFVSKHLVHPRVQDFEPNILDVHPSRFLNLADNVH